MSPRSARIALLVALVGLVFATAHTLHAASPAELLKADGHGEEWVKATAKCRELLGKVDLAEPKVAPHKPLIERLASLIRRTESFGWRQVPVVEMLEGVCEDLLAGKTPLVRYAGKGFAFPYWSKTLGRMEVIWLHVPPGYDPATEYQILFLYKNGGGVHFKNGKAHGGHRPTVEVANQMAGTFFTWSSLYYGVKGRMNVDKELAEASAAITKAFSVSPDRVFLSGYSDGGFTSVWLATRYPHLIAGTPATTTNWQYSNVCYPNLRNVAYLGVDGWSDGGYNTRNFITWHITRGLGYDSAGLWGHHGHSYFPFEDVETLRRMCDWMKTKRRNLWPKHVTYCTWNLTWHEAYWVSIERMADPALPCHIDVQVKDGNRIEVTARNVGAYKLSLSEKLVDVSKPVTVVTNGKPTYSGPASSSMIFELTEAKGKFVKNAATPGGMQARIVKAWYGLKRDGGFRVVGRRFLWVKPTGPGADKLAKWWPEWAKADTEVTDEQIAEYDLLLYGGPEINKLTRRIAAELPVKFAKGSFTVGSKVYDKPNQFVQFIHPNPLQSKRYVFVYAFNDLDTFAKIGTGRIGKPSAWGFRSGDCMVFNADRPERRWGVISASRYGDLDYHIFDANWQPAKAEPVGELTDELDYTQVLRLRADAIREVTGADVGICGYAPGYLRWTNRLAAGPVTTHDIAVSDALPQYICRYEASGSALLSLLGKAAVSTVLTDPRDPAFDPETSLLREKIDPKKTYTVASAFNGLPAYGAHPKKMPKLHYFETAEDWVKGGNTSLAIHNLRQIPIDLNEAVARYIKKRGKVSPRATVTDVVQYIMNPKANHLAGTDWLHLGLAAAWPRPGKADAVERYTLGLGFTAAEGRDASCASDKRFLDVDLTGKTPLNCTVAPAGRGTKVEVRGSIRPITVENGRAVLVDLKLTNAGKTDVSGMAVLSSMRIGRVNPGSWPSAGYRQKDPATFFRGMYSSTGPRRQPPVEQRAVLLLGETAPKLVKLVANGVGYNTGLVGLKESLAIKAGETMSMPILLVAVNKPKDVQSINLLDVVNALKAELLGGKEK